jgi:outer membrane protein, multidrug efflux system
MRSPGAVSVLLLGLAGCSLIPAYHRPALPVASQWPSGPASLAVAGEKAGGPMATDIGWREFFADPVLQDLINLSLKNNRDLRVAVLNVAEAQAQYGSDRASLFPTVDATASFEQSRIPGDVFGDSGLGAGGAENIREYSLGAGVVSWELDLFGSIRSEAQAAQQTYLSDADTQLSVQISLVAQVASEYLTWLADREALAVSQLTVKAQSDSLKLAQIQLQHGNGTALDAAQAETTLDSAEASADQFTRQVAQDMDQLVLLAGTPLPATLISRMNAEASLDSEPQFPDLPAGLPADLLQRRPDIRAAEHTLLAANANVGAARAAFFPEITLTANGGVASSGLNHLFAGGQGSWLFEPSISVPIFDAGQNFANLDIARLEKRVEIANYEKSIQSAFRDVSDALAARGTYVDQVAAEQALVDADTRFYQLADMRFRAGIDSYLNVLVAENDLLSARLTLIGLQLAAMQNTITLYKALGGGWQEHSSQTSSNYDVPD